METVTLILSLEETNTNNPSDRSSNRGVTAGVKVGQQQERWYSKIEPLTQLQLINVRIQGY